MTTSPRYLAEHRDGRTMSARKLGSLCLMMLAEWDIEADADDVAAQLDDGDEALVIDDGCDFPDDVLVVVQDREHVAG
jgi:hypothetical protein